MIEVLRNSFLWKRGLFAIVILVGNLVCMLWNNSTVGDLQLTEGLGRRLFAISKIS